MNSPENRNTSPSNPSERNSPQYLSASHEELHKLNSLLQTEAEIHGITQRLSRIEDYLRNPDGSANPYLDSLIKRRAELLKKSAPSSKFATSAPLHWINLWLRWAPFLLPGRRAFGPTFQRESIKRRAWPELADRSTPSSYFREA